jgi:hypothetical protein
MRAFDTKKDGIQSIILYRGFLLVHNAIADDCLEIYNPKTERMVVLLELRQEANYSIDEAIERAKVLIDAQFCDPQIISKLRDVIHDLSPQDLFEVAKKRMVVKKQIPLPLFRSSPC